jgi:hypothetical protein
MTEICWDVTIPNRDPAGGFLGNATTASLNYAFQIIHDELRTETLEKTWSYKADSRDVTYDEFCRLASIPGATGPFVASGPGGIARIESRPARGQQ